MQDLKCLTTNLSQSGRLDFVAYFATKWVVGDRKKRTRHAQAAAHSPSLSLILELCLHLLLDPM